MSSGYIVSDGICMYLAFQIVFHLVVEVNRENFVTLNACPRALLWKKTNRITWSSQFEHQKVYVRMCVRDHGEG